MGKTQRSSPQPDRWLRRIAILLSSLPASTAAELVQSLDQDAQLQVQQAVESLSGVEPAEREQVLREFRGKMFHIQASHQPRGSAPAITEGIEDEFEIRQSAESAVSNNNSSARLNRQVASVVSQWELPRTFAAKPHNESVFAFLDEVDDQTMVDLLSQEHPQTIALVFASITPKQAARILPRLDSDIHSETIRRIGRLDEVPEATATDVAAQLRERVIELQCSDFNSGQQALQAIIEAMPAEFDSPHFGPSEPGVATEVDVDDETLINEPERGADLLEPAPPTIPISAVATETGADPTPEFAADAHHYLLHLSREVLCRALGRVDTRDALLSLCGLPNEIAEQALSILPRAQAKRVRHDMANLGQLQLREIDEAKARVAHAASELTEYSSPPVAA